MFTTCKPIQGKLGMKEFENLVGMLSETEKQTKAQVDAQFELMLDNEEEMDDLNLMGINSENNDEDNEDEDEEFEVENEVEEEEDIIRAAMRNGVVNLTPENQRKDFISVKPQEVEKEVENDEDDDEVRNVNKVFFNIVLFLGFVFFISFSLSNTVIHSHPQYVSPSHTSTLSLTQPHSLYLSHSLPHKHIHTPIQSHTPFLSLSRLPFSLTPTLSRTLSRPLPPSFSHILSLTVLPSLSLSHTLSHTHTYRMSVLKRSSLSYLTARTLSLLILC